MIPSLAYLLYPELHLRIVCCGGTQEHGRSEYDSVQTADVMERRVANVAEDVDRSRCSFEQGDACDIRADMGTFDAVLAANLLCRLPKPINFLNRMPHLVNQVWALLLCFIVFFSFSPTVC